MKILIASDKAGFELKEKVKAYLLQSGRDVEDVGLTDPDGYMPFYAAAAKLCPAVAQGQAQRGILICGSGGGMCVCANKYDGIVAVVAESIYSAKMAAFINNANVLALGGNIVGPGMAFEMCDAFLDTTVAQGAAPERAAYLAQLNQDFQAFLRDLKAE